MHRRNPLARLASSWAGLCAWFLRISPLPPEHSLRLITRWSAIIGLPCPAVARR